MNYKFIVYDKQSNLLVAVYDLRVRKVTHVAEEDIINGIFSMGREIENIEFLVYDRETKQWLFKDSSLFEEHIETNPEFHITDDDIKNAVRESRKFLK